MPRAGVVVCLAVVAALSAAERNGPVPGPIFPADNWWNLDISQAPVDARSAQFIAFINNGGSRRLHPDFGGYASPGSVEIYGFPFIVVGGSQPKRAVDFYYASESDGVDRATGGGVPFYPIPDQAIAEPYWIEGGPPGNQRPGGDRHMIILDRDNRHLYELYDLYWDGTQWRGGSGAFFDLSRNARRPDGWTSADAAGLAIFPGLVRYDEAFGSDEIRHAFRVTVRATNGYVWPASHRAGSHPQALPMGARLRLKASKDLSGFRPELQRIFRAMQRYGLIVADNGSDMYVSGVFDPRWNNDILNPAFRALTASDFDVVELGWRGGTGTPGPSCPLPAAPAAFSYSLSGRYVVLVWAGAVGAAEYLLEAGTAAGAANLLVTSVGSVTSVGTLAPPGTYFVRVRARNACGTSDASNELTITVL
ncbi:MAG: hypothetical protein AB1635_12620 [Acidobacteriota bacterium]